MSNEGANSLLSRLVHCIRAIVGAFDSNSSSTILGRAKERQRRIVLSGLASLLAKVISVSTALISVPLTLTYLGAERFGMWMTMSSLIAFLSFADLGIGNGLLTSVASAHGRDDRTAIRAQVSSAYFILTLIALTVLAVFALAYLQVEWHRIFNVNSELARVEAAPAVAVLVGCYALAIPANVAQRVQMGLQKGYMASLWQCAASVLGLIGVLIAIHLKAPLPVLVLAFVGAPLLVNCANSLMFFGFLEQDISPARNVVSRQAIWTIMGTGMLFLILQIVVAVTFMSDNVIIAQILGAAAVADYAVPEKLFALISTVIAMVLVPLWPAYGEAIARGDRDWVSKTLRRSLLVSVGAAAICSGALVMAAPTIIMLWVGNAVTPPLLLLAGFGVWKVVEAAGQSLAMFLNGARVILFQVVSSILTAVAALLLKIFLVTEIGIAGAVWATIISYIVMVLVPFILLRRRILDAVWKH